MALFHRKRLLASKIETVSGTDAVPTGVDAMLVDDDLTISPLEATAEERTNIKPFFGGKLATHVGEHVRLSFSVEMAGAGAAGDVPGYGALLRACANSETVTAATDVAYSPVSENIETMTHYFNLDGQLHIITGSIGSMSFNWEPKKNPKYKFEFIGRYNTPQSVAAITPDFSAFKAPTATGCGKTSAFDLGGWSGTPLSLSFDDGNNTVFHETLTTCEFFITDRKSTGRLVVEAAAMSEKNFFDEALQNTVNTLTIQNGQTAGSIVQFDSPQVQIMNPSYGESNGISTIEMDLSFVPTDAGNDEYTVTIR